MSTTSTTSTTTASQSSPLMGQQAPTIHCLARLANRLADYQAALHSVPAAARAQARAAASVAQHAAVSAATHAKRAAESAAIAKEAADNIVSVKPKVPFIKPELDKPCFAYAKCLEEWGDKKRPAMIRSPENAYAAFYKGMRSDDQFSPPSSDCYSRKPTMDCGGLSDLSSTSSSGLSSTPFSRQETMSAVCFEGPALSVKSDRPVPSSECRDFDDEASRSALFQKLMAKGQLKEESGLSAEDAIMQAVDFQYRRGLFEYHRNVEAAESHHSGISHRSREVTPQTVMTRTAGPEKQPAFFRLGSFICLDECGEDSGEEAISGERVPHEPQAVEAAAMKKSQQCDADAASDKAAVTRAVAEDFEPDVAVRDAAKS